MSRRIDIELTSALGDGTWTWRAAGARQPKGVLDGSILPSDAKVGDELKVEVEQELDGITILNVVHGREKQERTDLLELLPDERDFQPVVEHRAKRDRGERRGRGDGRGGRGRDGDRGGRDGRGRDGDGRGRDGRGRDRDGRGGRDGDGRGRDGRGRDGRGRDGRGRDGRGERRRRGPSFDPPPEVPQRPKPKRLRPGKANRNAVLAELPEEQRPIAELTLQGMKAVRQRLKEENDKAVAEGRPAMPEASVLKMAEELLPRLRVAEWRDRAEAAQRQMEHLDLRDLRSVVAAAGDPAVAREESTAALAQELQEALARKQDEELQLWFGDVDAALAVGRVIRALRLSSQPPKAGVPFPVDIAQRLVDSTNASLAPMDGPDRWSAMLEAAAFSPVRSLIRPVRKPDTVSGELMATVKRLAPALPQVAELFEIEVDPNAPMPKPLRPGPRQRKGKAGDAKSGDGRSRDGKPGDGRSRDGKSGDGKSRDGRRRDGERKDRADASDEPATDAAPPANETPAEEPAHEPKAETTDPPAEAPVEQPTTDTANEPTEEPATDDSPPEEPVAEEPTTDDSPSEEPVAEEPATDDSPSEEPVAEEPTTEEPATDAANEPTEEPATEEPTAEEPAS